MLKSLTLPEPIRSLSTGQKLLIGIGTAVLLFLIFGTFSQDSSTPEFAVGLQTQPFAVLALLAFGGGLLSFASPCTLPVLTAYFAFAFQSGRKQIAANTIAFMLGLATTFTVLGAVGFEIGKVLVGNQQLLILIGGAVVMGFGVLSLLGKGFGGVDVSGTGGVQPKNTTLRGSYFFGLSFAVGWTSCIGPILGVVLTLAAQTTSVWNGMMLLFIYTLGLGLPLLVVSTFFGRMSRQSFFWRFLRGKGWELDTHTFVVALVWALAIWRVLVAVLDYIFFNFRFFDGQTVTLGHEIGLLAVTLIGAALWVFTSSEERRVTVHLHSTQLISGALFILLAVLMLNGTLTSINALVGQYEFSEWFVILEDRFIEFFQP
ncbi:cytochrome c biogenesis CcdA family protein [Candidatus Leptofilum sp.]|uniref:cytochrome c biogenesis CcdA family protein n=1 Tax=Candidatus Leptofilum sp. TaxID=3241576 RepID=UPI003B5C715C